MMFVAEFGELAVIFYGSQWRSKTTKGETIDQITLLNLLKYFPRPHVVWLHGIQKMFQAAFLLVTQCSTSKADGKLSANIPT